MVVITAKMIPADWVVFLLTTPECTANPSIGMRPTKVSSDIFKMQTRDTGGAASYCAAVVRNTPLSRSMLGMHTAWASNPVSY